MGRANAYAPRLARAVRGGLRLQGGRREAWWRRRLLAWLEGMRMGARLGRGRNYAQQGQIRALSVLPGLLEAEVQGAEAAPYHTRVEMAPLDAAAVGEILRARPFLAAQLAAHALPLAFDEALRQAGFSLLPEGRRDLRLRCDCKDWARPCKHLAAVLCLFADATAADPALLLRFRGIEPPAPPDADVPRVAPEAEVARLHPSADAGAVPRRLGALPYWRGEEPFVKTLEGAYRRAQAKALAAQTAFSDFRFPEDFPAR